MEEKNNIIKVTLQYYDEDANVSEKVFSIKQNPIKNISKSGIGWKQTLYKITYTLVLPDHIHKYMLGKIVERNRGIGNSDRESYVDLAKSITSETINWICIRYWTITQDYLYLKKLEKAELQKVIFYNFDNNTGELNSSWDGVKLGTTTKIKFNYCIGFISDTKDRVNRYNTQRKFIGEPHNRDFYNNMKYIVWTQEREDFFNGIQSGFENIVDKIEAFDKNLSEETINTIIHNKQKLLG